MIWLSIDPGKVGERLPQFVINDISPELWTYYRILSSTPNGTRAVTALLKAGITSIGHLKGLYHTGNFTSIKGIGPKCALELKCGMDVLLRDNDILQSALPSEEEIEKNDKYMLELVKKYELVEK